MDNPLQQREIKPRKTKQTFNILLHQALEEETEQQADLARGHKVAPVASPLSCPSDSLNKDTPWEPPFVSMIKAHQLKPPPAAVGSKAIRMKYSRHKKSKPEDSDGEVLKTVSEVAIPVASELTNYDSVELEKKLFNVKPFASSSISDTETDDVEEARSNRNRRKTKKSQRVKLLGVFDLNAKFNEKKQE